MKSMSFTVFSYNATVLLIQPNSPNPLHVLENVTQPNPIQPMDGPNPCPSLEEFLRLIWLSLDIPGYGLAIYLALL